MPGPLQMEDGAMAIIVSLDESVPYYCWAHDDTPHWAGIPGVYLYEGGTFVTGTAVIIRHIGLDGAVPSCYYSGDVCGEVNTDRMGDDEVVWVSEWDLYDPDDKETFDKGDSKRAVSRHAVMVVAETEWEQVESFRGLFRRPPAEDVTVIRRRLVQ